MAKHLSSFLAPSTFHFSLTIHHLILISILILFHALALHPIKAERNSFGFDLFHRDSKFSPFYNQSMTESELSRKSFLCSLNWLKQSNSSMNIEEKAIGSSDINNLDGEYFMDLYIGKLKVKTDEPTTILAYPSMADYLTWVRCGPCTSCKHPHKFFYDPTKSDSYLPVDYVSGNCKAMKHIRKRGESEVCEYEYHSDNEKFSGSDKYASSGVLSTETLYLKSLGGENQEFSDIVFGCDKTHEGNFKHGVQAVVGLGQGSPLISLVSQLGKKIGKIFSYCLVSRSNGELSKIKFGEGVEKLYNRTIEFKAKIIKDSLYSFYSLSLKTIKINGEKIMDDIPIEKRQMKIDIQTALTTLPTSIYNKFLAKFVEVAGYVNPIVDPVYGTCFHNSELSSGIPDIELHLEARFGSKAVFQLRPKNFLLDIGHSQCLTIVPTEGTYVSVLGNQAQIDFQMIFDPSAHVLTYAPVDCTRYSI